MKPATITVLYSPGYGRAPMPLEVRPELKTYQGLVGGFVERVEHPEVDGVDVVLNEDGKSLYPLNKDNVRRQLLMVSSGEIVDLIVGPYFLVRVDDEGNWVGLTDADLANPKLTEIHKHGLRYNAEEE